MKAIAIPLAGLLAAGGLIVAQLYPLLKIVDTNTVLLLSEKGWGGGGRLWAGAGLMVMGTLLWALGARRWAAFFSGITMGLLVDISFSAVQWRKDQLSGLAGLGMSDFKPTIEWQLGTPGLLVAVLFILVFFLQSGWPARAPAPAPSLPVEPLPRVYL
jgi:hypothetical protein